MGPQPLERRVILEAGKRAFESEAVLNPAAYIDGDQVHLFYRAVRTGNFSSIGYAVFDKGELSYRALEPVLKPERSWERHGVEDPRLVRLEDRFQMFYVAYDGHDVQIARAEAKMLPYFKKEGPVSPMITYGEIKKLCKIGDPNSYLCSYAEADLPSNQLLWDKDSFIFPERVGGKLVMVHRIHPNMQLLFFDSFEQLDKKYWLHYLGDLESQTVLRRRFWFENGYIGGGAPPVRTEAGWLMIYHAVEQEDGKRTYRAGAALLDLENPLKVIGRLRQPLFGPEEKWERVGIVPDVVFPTGAVIRGETLEVYYGAADTCIGMISFRLAELLTELKNSPEEDI